VLRLRAPIAIDERGELGALLGVPVGERLAARVSVVVDAGGVCAGST
jgi:hypothetical protein